MLCTNKIHQAPSTAGKVFLGRTLPSLLDEACDRAPNTQAFNQWTETGWQPRSNQQFREAAEAVALGLLDLGLNKGDRVALLMYSDVNFCITDMGCLLAHLVDVPIDLTQTLEHIVFVLQHSEAKALVVSNSDLLTQLEPYLWDIPALQHILVAKLTTDWQQTRQPWISRVNPLQGLRSDTTNYSEATCLELPMALHAAPAEQTHAALPQRIHVWSLDEVQDRGQAQYSTSRLQQLRAELIPADLATIIYIPDATGQMQGVMLTHENLSANALTSFAVLPDLELGAQERILSFLPLNHVLARCLLYGHIHYGHSIYFSNPNRVSKHFKEIQPTILVTVPLFLEKIYSKILEKGNKLGPLWERILFHWALKLAQRYEIGCPIKGLYALLLKLADWLVLSKWRAVFGGHLKYVICGGAALRAELANVFAAAGVTILQGYGLTQASAVVCCNRGSLNRAGTVGVPIAGVEIAIADDSEILIRGPYITSGYYKNPTATRDLLDEQGWLHTGDLGTFTDDGFLKITGLKKALFKLSTGKYIAPQPIEQRLKQSPLVAQAIAVGSERKYCSLLIFPNLDALHVQALELGLDLPVETLLKHPCILALYQSLVDAANCHLPYWGTVKRFQVLNASLTIENGLLTSTQTLNRTEVLKQFAQEIDALYGEEGPRSGSESDGILSSVPIAAACSPTTSSACPAFAQSLNPRLTTS